MQAMREAYLKSLTFLPSTNKVNIKPKMTPFLTSTTLFVFSLIVVLSTFVIVSDAKFSEQFPEMKDAHPVEKVSHLHFFFHDIVSEDHPTALIVAGKKNVFGMTSVIDDSLTEGPELGSKVVGRAQGMYSLSSKDGTTLLMAMNLVFKEGKYNGSSISILGSNKYQEAVREMPVKFTLRTAVVEYNVFVMHH